MATLEHRPCAVGVTTPTIPVSEFQFPIGDSSFQVHPRLKGRVNGVLAVSRCYVGVICVQSVGREGNRLWGETRFKIQVGLRRSPGSRVAGIWEFSHARAIAWDLLTISPV